MKTFNRHAICLSAMLMLVAALPAVAGSPQGVCQAGGVNSVVLQDAMTTYFNWYFTGTGQQQVGQQFLVPIPNGTPISADPLIFQGSASFTVRPGSTLVLPMSVFSGESYVGGVPPNDDPVLYFIDYRASRLLLTVDGRVVVDSTRTKLDCVYVNTFYFPQPIVYPVPSSYGSNAAIWMTGLGILLPPMSLGEHIIDMQVVSPTAPVFGVDVGYYNTWYVTVVKP